MIWTIQIVAKDSLGCPVFDICRMSGSEAEIIGLVAALAKLPRPVAVGTAERAIWLSDGDLLLAVPVPR